MKISLIAYFSHMLFVPQASQSSLYRGQNLRFCPRFLRQKIIACGMEINMRMYFKQRMFSWFDSYDIYDEQGNTLYVVKGQLAWGHCLKIFDAYGQEVGTVNERLLTFLPKFEIYLGDTYLGCIKKEFSFFKPQYDIEYNGWHIDGSFLEWDYNITDSDGYTVATISKEILHWTDQYVIDVVDENDALTALMFVLAVDAEKCSRND